MVGRWFHYWPLLHRGLREFCQICKELLCKKLWALQLPRCLWSLLRRWLDDKSFQVGLDGVLSAVASLADSMCQNTGVGPNYGTNILEVPNTINEPRGTEMTHTETHCSRRRICTHNTKKQKTVPALDATRIDSGRFGVVSGFAPQMGNWKSCLSPNQTKRTSMFCTGHCQ